MSIIKKGGMGAVFLARDRALADSLCAVKEVLPAVAGSAHGGYVVARFEEEMKALVGLSHPAIPRVRDFFQTGELSYIVMDYVEGPNLEDARPTTPEDAVRDTLRLLETLAYLHRHKPAVLHRDIKPSNIIRDKRDGLIKLVDFGLAKQMDGSQVQTAVGTPGFCAPEQMVGRAEPRSDLYSVGVTLHYWLTGVEPGLMHFAALRPSLPGLRPGLAEVVEKATELKVLDRYLTAEEMADDLRKWLSNPPLAVGVTALAQKAAPSNSLMLVGFALTLTLGLLGGLMLRGNAVEKEFYRVPVKPLHTPTPAAEVAHVRVPVAPAPPPVRAHRQRHRALVRPPAPAPRPQKETLAPVAHEEPGYPTAARVAAAVTRPLEPHPAAPEPAAQTSAPPASVESPWILPPAGNFVRSQQPDGSVLYLRHKDGLEQSLTVSSFEVPGQPPLVVSQHLRRQQPGSFGVRIPADWKPVPRPDAEGPLLISRWLGNDTSLGCLQVRLTGTPGGTRGLVTRLFLGFAGREPDSWDLKQLKDLRDQVRLRI